MSNIRRRLMMSNVEDGDLPSGYTRLEYIEGQGAIVTDYIPQSNSIIRYEWQLNVTGPYSTTHDWELGEGITERTYTYQYLLSYGGNYIYDHIYDRIWTHPTYGDMLDTYEYLELFNRSEGIDTEKHTYLYANIFDSDGLSTDGSNLLFFTKDETTFANGKIYRFQAWDSDLTLLCDFIPVENNDSEGLYDVVNKKFYAFKKLNKVTHTVRSEIVGTGNCFEYEGEMVCLNKYNCYLDIKFDFVLKSDVVIKYKKSTTDSYISATAKAGTDSLTITVATNTLSEVSITEVNIPSDEYFYYG